MSSKAEEALAVPELTKAHKDITSSQASYTSMDAEKTDVENGDGTDIDMEKRESINLETDENKGATPAPDKINDSEYPKGAKLASIVLALALAVFLMSLDFVCA